MKNTFLKTVALFILIITSEKYSAQSPNFKIKNPYYSHTVITPLRVTNTEWKKILSPELYQVTREGATETAFTGKYYELDEKGTYYCAVCGNALFLSTSKFATTCGWPSFYQPIRNNSVKYRKDTSHNMVRSEVLCGRCDSHLGHIFDDGPKPTGKRFCMNSVCLDFIPNSKKQIANVK
jgi:peptide-methionine (R)-S-oxide reductase